MNESHHRISEPRFTLQGPSPLAGHPLGLTSALPRLEPQTDLLRLPTSVTTVNSCYSPVFIPDRRRNTNGTDDGSADGRPAPCASRRRRPDQRGCGRPPRGCRRLGVPRKNSGRHDSAHNADLREVSSQHSKWYLEASSLSLKTCGMFPRSLARREDGGSYTFAHVCLDRVS